MNFLYKSTVLKKDLPSLKTFGAICKYNRVNKTFKGGKKMAGKEILSFDIHGITTVTEKHENAGFEFHNPCRMFDGFVLFTDGEAELSRIGEETAIVKKDDIVIFNQGDNYRFYAEKPCSYITCGLFLEYPVGNKSKALPKIARLSHEQVQKIREFSEIWEMRKFDSVITCKIGIMSLYLELFRETSAKEYSEEDPAISRALDYLHKNFKRNFKTDEIARYCNLSSSYLRSRFYDKVGMTITEYRDRLRIKAARELLSGGEFSVKETAAELGFCDVYHFSKFFARHTNITPARFARDPKKQ